MIDADLWRSASHRNMLAHLAGPIRAGAIDDALPIDGDGKIVVDHATREPLVVIGPAGDLGARTLTVTVTREGGAEGFINGTLTFADWTERGAYLPAYRPDVDAVLRSAGSFTLALAATFSDADGTTSGVAAGDLGAVLEARIVEGVAGRMAVLLAAEKARVRRELGVVAASRRIETARAGALDRIGAELGVRRFSSVLAYDPATKSISEAHLASDGSPVLEPDPSYRRRLALYRPLQRANRSGVLAALGLRGEVGFGLDEADDIFAVTAVSIGVDGPFRDDFLAHVRAAYLVWLERAPNADAAHDARFLPADRTAATTDLRDRLSAAFKVPADGAVAPVLASTLDTIGKAAAALGLPMPLTVKRAQDSAGGSRYELGLGVDLERPAPADLAAAAAAIRDPGFVMPRDLALAGVLAAVRAALDADGEDAGGAWLFGPCGARTVHELDASTVYLSHLPVSGLVIEGPTTAAAGAATGFTARFLAPGDAGLNAALAASLATAAAAWTGAGNAPWTEVAPAAAGPVLATATTHGPADPVFTVFAGAGLPNTGDAAATVGRLQTLPGELWAVLTLAAPDAAELIAGGPDAIDRLSKLVAVLRPAGVVSVLPLVTSAGEVLLVAAAIGLPEAGLNLADRRATGFRWYTVPIQGPGASVGAIGSRTTFEARGPGVFALVCVGYASRGKTTPYEVAVTLPDGALLDLEGYEFAMNALEQVHPMGVMFSTYRLRREHVDLDGDGTADPLPVVLSRTYRRFRFERDRGQSPVEADV